MTAPPAFPLAVPTALLQVGPSGIAAQTDLVADEWPLTLVLENREWVTLLCSPDRLEDLAIGVLAGAGAISGIRDLLRIDWETEENPQRIVARITRSRPLPLPAAPGLLASCCGQSRPLSTGGLLRPVTSDLRISIPECFRLMEELNRCSALFASTGGVHNACLSTRGGRQDAASDVGRHNAIDKLYGRALREERDLGDAVIAFSGRISAEILLKVAALGVPVLLSRAAPTARALALAQDLSVTTVGFVRGDRFNIYTHPQRIVEAAKGDDAGNG